LSPKTHYSKEEATKMSRKGNNADLAPSKKERMSVGQIILLICLFLFTVFCFAPVLLVFISAFTDEVYITQHGFSFFPEKWSMSGMNAVLKYGKQLFTSYAVTIFVTVAGTLLGLLIMSMYAYAMSRKDFRLSKFLAVFLLIPMLFNGGQLSGYIVFTSMYHLKDSLLLLILPLCVTTMNVIILRTYIVNSIPAELMEAAKIDGAGEYRTFFQITLPLLKPSLAAVGFMMATAYWNDWQNALLYIDTNSKKPLQLLLVNIQKSIQFLLNNNNVPASVRAAMGGSIPQNSATMATVIIVIGPIMVAYPFFQKYFIKGLTVGSVKG
jgi:multiple sugar transport system permease protein/putative aldouronate transport system permease protein